MSISVPDLINRLGGHVTVASALGVTAQAVKTWKWRGEVPGRYVLPLWSLALKADVEWQPAGADEIRERLKDRDAA